MSYLDDADHDWSLDPGALTPDPIAGFPDWLDLMDELFHRKPPVEAMELIFKGYFGLRERHPDAPPVQCLETSMIWYYG